MLAGDDRASSSEVFLKEHLKGGIKGKFHRRGRNLAIAHGCMIVANGQQATGMAYGQKTLVPAVIWVFPMSPP